MKSRLRPIADFKCRRCTGDARPLDGQPVKSIAIGGETLEVVDKFCYLGDMISAGGGAGESLVSRIRSGWKKFRELLPLLTSRGFSLRTKGHVFEACVRSVVLYGSETWPLKEDDLARLEQNDMRMVHCMCNVTLKDRKSSEELRDHLGLVAIRDCVQRGRLRWFGHVERMNNDNWLKKLREIAVEGCRGRGRPCKTWKEVVQADLRAKGIQHNLAQDSAMWVRAIK